MSSQDDPKKIGLVIGHRVLGTIPKTNRRAFLSLVKFRTCGKVSLIRLIFNFEDT